MDTFTPSTIVSEGYITTTSTQSDDDRAQFYYKLSERIFLIIMPFILVIGVIGNFLTIIIMNRKSLRSNSVSVYLTALAVSDTLVLLLDFLNNWVKMAANIYLLGSSTHFCRFHRFIFDTIFTYSSWLVVAVSVERFLVVWFPLKAKIICTVKTARIVTCILPVITFAIYFYKLFGWTLDEDGFCNMTPKYQHFENFVGPWLSGTLYSYVPITVLIIINVLIIIRLTRMAAQRSSLTGEGKKAADQTQKERKITITIIIICIVFILLTAPLAIFYILMFFIGEYIFQSPKIALAEVIILLIGLSNYAVNFFLYVLTSEGFRHELKNVLCWSATCKKLLKKKQSETSSLENVQSQATDESQISGTRF